MDDELEALLALQADDEIVDGLVVRLDALAPRVAALDAQRERALALLQQAEGALEAEERRRRTLEQRVSEHRQKQERNVAQLDMVKRMREAEAAMHQMETGRKMLLEGEDELQQSGARLDAIRLDLDQQRAALDALAGEQTALREVVGRERAALEVELAAAQRARDGVAERVSASLRSKYERIRSRRRTRAVYPLESGACSACDTAIPLQRRNQMTGGRRLDVCEACGVLLYVTE